MNTKEGNMTSNGKCNQLELDRDTEDGFDDELGTHNMEESMTKKQGFKSWFPSSLSFSEVVCFLLGFSFTIPVYIYGLTNNNCLVPTNSSSTPPPTTATIEPTISPTASPSASPSLSPSVSPTSAPPTRIPSTQTPSSQPGGNEDDFVSTPRCGTTWEDANDHCYGSCQRDADCFFDRTCFFDLATDCPSIVDLPMPGTLSFADDIGNFKNHWNMPLDKWNMCCGEGHYCSTCYGQSCCTGEPDCCRLGDNYDPECCHKARGRCYWDECLPCPAGTYSPVGGFYQRGVPGYTCPPCPPGTTSEEGATECYPAIVV